MLTAPKISENEMIRYKSAKETSLLEIKEVERGKPPRVRNPNFGRGAGQGKTNLRLDVLCT